MAQENAATWELREDLDKLDLRVLIGQGEVIIHQQSCGLQNTASPDIEVIAPISAGAVRRFFELYGTSADGGPIQMCGRCVVKPIGRSG